MQPYLWLVLLTVVDLSDGETHTEKVRVRSWDAKEAREAAQLWILSKDPDYWVKKVRCRKEVESPIPCLDAYEWRRYALYPETA